MSYACYIQRIIPPASLVVESPWTDYNNSNGKKSLNKGSYSSNTNNIKKILKMGDPLFYSGEINLGSASASALFSNFKFRLLDSSSPLLHAWRRITYPVLAPS